MAKIKIQSTVLKRAVIGDKAAIKTMFQSFISEDESILDVQYLGSYGFLFKTRSFVCVSDRKIASMEYGPFGKIIYTDAFIEDVNSGVIYQPSIFPLYFVGLLLCLTIVGILLLNSWIRLYYQLHKSGLVWIVREGVNVYAFANRSKINLVNDFWRKSSYLRTKRKEFLKA